MTAPGQPYNLRCEGASEERVAALGVSEATAGAVTVPNAIAGVYRCGLFPFAGLLQYLR